MEKFKCLITDYQGDNCNYEIEQLEKNNIQAIVSKIKKNQSKRVYAEKKDILR